MKLKFIRKLKIITALCLSVAIGFSSPGISSAQDNNGSEVTVSEYQLVKDNLKLLEKNPKMFSSEEKESLENYKEVFDMHIAEMNKLTNKELENLDYDLGQINAIRDYDGQEENIEKASAKVTFTIKKNSGSYSGGRTNVNVFARFLWSGVPGFQFTDAFGVTNGELMYFSNKSNPFSTTYKSTSGKQKSYSGTLTRQGNGNTGTTTKFPILKYESTGKYYLSSGSANIPLYRDAKVKSVGIGVAYGHSYLYPTISISVSGSGHGVGIGFSSGVTKYSDNNIITCY